MMKKEFLIVVRRTDISAIIQYDLDSKLEYTTEFNCNISCSDYGFGISGYYYRSVEDLVDSFILTSDLVKELWTW